ncbi:hypothetical protein HWV23_08090 [Natronomonas halophila]|uniref:hypothetical protein n=1 Tax=Natronomonas halophila TaxID=2747817 RepID=UPI0015B602C1|nr:hypothetical protein [Natronomonas halophila]QLD85686.1 hypothetical protein HWV23_08090 [Natronomonas halophila]
MSDSDPESRIDVTFHPQAWVDTAGKSHERGRKQLIPAEGREPVRFTVPRADGTDSSGQVFEDESYEANRLRDHSAAPDWVNAWDGPYFVTMDAE